MTAGGGARWHRRELGRYAEMKMAALGGTGFGRDFEAGFFYGLVGRTRSLEAMPRRIYNGPAHGRSRDRWVLQIAAARSERHWTLVVICDPG